jgi:pimeloyl-ACP methyl ester carboxylesterase
MTSRLDIRVDVTGRVPLDADLEIAAVVHLPDRIPAERPSVVFAFPGATYSRAYYDLHVPGRDGYSFAEHVAELGHVVVACDHIGIGDSTPYEPFCGLTMEVVVGGAQAAVDGVRSQLVGGTLDEGLPPITDPFTIGVGHSVGGQLVVLQQARGRTFDAVALLGCARPSEGAAAQVAAARAETPDPTWIPRPLLHHLFHDETVPTEVIAADDVLAVRTYAFLADRIQRTRWYSAFEAARRDIDVPVFLGFGARDISDDPRREPANYANADDITTFVLPDGAHCFNYAGSRKLFFDRFSAWIQELAKLSDAMRT